MDENEDEPEDEVEFHDGCHVAIDSCNEACEHPDEELSADERIPFTRAYIDSERFLREWGFTLK